MLPLREVQEAFADAAYGGTTVRLAREIVPPGNAEARIAIYRSNVFSNFTEALRAVYPVVERLVGEEFFLHAAREYVRGHPSRSGDIHDYGEHFPDFLAEFRGASALAYLPDTARLEWTWHRLFHAAECPPLDLARLAAVPADRCDKLVFRLHPASALLASPYPVHRIWQVNQPEWNGDARVSLDEGGVRLLLFRTGYVIEIEPLRAGEFALLEGLALGLSVTKAYGCARASEPEIDMQACLARRALQGLIVDFDDGGGK